MNRFVAMFAVAFICTPTPAGAIDLPPSQYDYAYPGELTVVEAMPGHNLYGETYAFAICDNMSKQYGWGAWPTKIRSDVIGCAIGGNFPGTKDPAKCTIVITPQWNRYLTAKLIRHELGHCNGWRHD